jgi:hypothetical protein
MKQAVSNGFACCLLRAGFLLSLLINPEEGSDMLLRNVD